jgi:hypothetical protein
VTEEYNFVDLVWHECEFREGDSFAYAVYDAADRYLGCCYLYPLGPRTPLTADRLEHDVDVSWWVTPDAYSRQVTSTPPSGTARQRTAADPAALSGPAQVLAVAIPASPGQRSGDVLTAG